MDIPADPFRNWGLPGAAADLCGSHSDEQRSVGLAAATALANSAQLGAKTCVPVMSIGEIGRIAVIQDPQGATIGLHEFNK